MEKLKEIKGFMMTCKQFFGYRDGQKLKGFTDEMSELDMAFKKEIHEHLKSMGVECRAPDAFNIGKA